MFILSSADSSPQFPPCLSGPASVISGHYNTLDSLVSRVISTVAGGEDTEWRDMVTNTGGNFSTQLYKVDTLNLLSDNDYLIYRNTSMSIQVETTRSKTNHLLQLHSTLTAASFSSSHLSKSILC